MWLLRDAELFSSRKGKSCVSFSPLFPPLYKPRCEKTKKPPRLQAGQPQWNGVPTKFMCVFLSIRANNYVPVKARLVHRKLRGGNFSMCCRWVKCKMYIALISHDPQNRTYAPIQRFQSSQRRSTPKAQSKRCSPCPYIPKCRNCFEFYTRWLKTTQTSLFFPP